MARLGINPKNVARDRPFAEFGVDSLTRSGVRIIRPEAPWHGRRRREGWFGGEPVLLPPLFLHFALVFPERPDAWVRSDSGRTLVQLIYLPALLLGAISVASVVYGAGHGEMLTRVTIFVDRSQLAYLVVTLIGGLAGAVLGKWLASLARMRGGVFLGAVVGGVLGAAGLAIAWEAEGALTGALYGTLAGAAAGPVLYAAGVFALNWRRMRRGDLDGNS